MICGMNSLPETILQFGAGKFFRAFADLFIHQANEAGQELGRVVVVQSTGDDRAGLLNQQKGRYHVLIRGLQDGKTIDRVEESASISRALVASHQWDDVLQLARSPQLRYVLSNTTEVGYTLDPADREGDRPPRSFPAKLLAILFERFRAGAPGLSVIPCELFENNSAMLNKLVLELAESWQLPTRFRAWLQDDCVWLSTLVDRIVVNKPAAHPLLEKDPLLLVAEPYALWAIQDRAGAGPFLKHPAVVRAADVQPYFLRKVRILNAAHTALVGKAKARGIPMVREAVLDPEIRSWLQRLLFEEIVPTVADRVVDAEGFARQTLERFENPFMEHRFSDIAKYHPAKLQIRLQTTRDEYLAKFGKAPDLLDEAIAAPV
jgi:tagaturonate reductase